MSNLISKVDLCDWKILLFLIAPLKFLIVVRANFALGALSVSDPCITLILSLDIFS